MILDLAAKKLNTSDTFWRWINGISLSNDQLPTSDLNVYIILRLLDNLVRQSSDHFQERWMMFVDEQEWSVNYHPFAKELISIGSILLSKVDKENIMIFKILPELLEQMSKRSGSVSLR